MSVIPECVDWSVFNKPIGSPGFVHSSMVTNSVEGVQSTYFSTSVNHPKHYNHGSIEVIDVIEDWQLDFHEGNIIKYIGRSKYKGNYLEDLKKAKFYLDRLISNIENNSYAGDQNVR